VAIDEDVLLSKGYGWADRDKNIHNDLSTIFNIGSVTKQFTAAAILKLMESGKLSVSDKLIHYFPQTPADKQDITIHQLLTHTTGISPQTGGFRYTPASKEQFLNEFFQSELMYPPGSKHSYANANYIVLAAIIEIVSNQEYETFLREQFWNPLDMEHTGYKKVVLENNQLAHGYYYNYTEGEWKDWGATPDHLPANKNHWYSIGKGDIYSSVQDMFKWYLALEQGIVISQESKALMETRHVPENAEESSFYGYGWAIFNSSRNTKIVTHNGSNGIYFADFIRYPEENIVVIALSNKILNWESENVAWDISSMIFDEDYVPKIIPKNSYELVIEYIKIHSPEEVNYLPQYINKETGNNINDKAILNRIGFNLVSENRDIDWGIALLNLNVKLFPGDGNLWDTLGEGYFLLGDKENAIESFKQAIKLGDNGHCHWCDNSRKRIQELTKMTSTP